MGKSDLGKAEKVISENAESQIRYIENVKQTSVDTRINRRKKRKEYSMNKLKIGNVTLENNLVLAPMAGVTDLPFRLLCRRQGAGLLCMEMVSAKAIYYKNKNNDT